MKKYFITYGDEKFTKAKERILQEAKLTMWFDSVTGYGVEDISDELKDTGLMDIPRGGGLWAWKPDVILKTLEGMKYGDILVYADSGCTLQPCKEWERIGKILNKYDIIAQNIYQKTDKWTRKEILNEFKSNPRGWEQDMQFCATVIILKKTEFSVGFIREWRDLIISNPEYIKDVKPKEKVYQHKNFFENRHDQSIYSALIYRHLSSEKIYRQWERIEDYNPFRLQAVRATRLRNGEKFGHSSNLKGSFKRIFKILFYRTKII